MHFNIQHHIQYYIHSESKLIFEYTYITTNKGLRRPLFGSFFYTARTVRLNRETSSSALKKLNAVYGPLKLTRVN